MKTTNSLPETGFLRLPQILAVFPVKKSTWWAGCASGKYPKSVKHGGVTFWKAADIQALIKEVEKEAA